MQIVYVSSATAILGQGRLERIARVSAENNARLGITGILIHQSDHFCGVLEGERARVLALMEVIITDPHHCRLRVLHEGAIAARRFSNWSFAELPPDADRPATEQTAARFARDLARRLK